MNQSTHSQNQNARQGSGKPGNNEVVGMKKDQVVEIIEQAIIEKFKSMYKDQEIQQEKLYRDKQDQLKDDQGATQIWAKLNEWASDTTFKKFSTQIGAARNVSPPELKARFVKQLNDQHNLLSQVNQDKTKVKIKLNAFYSQLVKSTTANLGSSINSFQALERAGCCGVGSAMKGFEIEMRKLEFDFIQWSALPKLDNNNVELYVFRPQINFDELRTFMIKQLRDYYPEGNGETRIVEKIVPQIVEKVVEKIVEKRIEVPVYVEKIIEKKVEIKVPEYREVVKEVYKDVPIGDKIREAHEMLYGIGRPQNVTEALTLYYEEAEVNNNVLAFNSIAQIFYEGKYFPKDLNKSYTYWEKSAAQQDPEGLYRIGRLMIDKKIDGIVLSQGRIQNRDQELQEAVVYLQNASEQGHLDALVDLGEIFEHGLKSQDNQNQFIQEPLPEQAEFYYQQGKKVRYNRAINALGLFYLNHPDFQEAVSGNNARKAIKYFEMARELGYVKSLYWLAYCYESGQGVQPNQELAKSYYKEGALRGDSDCKIHYMHFIIQDASNSGQQEDYLFCHNYLIQIVNSNPELTEAYYYLGHLYECGFGVLKDPNNAIHYYFKGSKLGNASCKTKLGDCYHCGFGVPQNQREALKYYKEAAALKDSEALINMGTIYEQGYEGVPIDFAKAFDCYEEAAKQSSAKAEFHLGLMYETGRYVKKDINFAIERYKKSAIMGCKDAREILSKKQIPILYDDGVNTADIEMEDNEKQGLMPPTSQLLPMISNPLLVQQGKKTNPSILASKTQRVETGEAKMMSILSQQIGNHQQYVQSQIQRTGFHQQ